MLMMLIMLGDVDDADNVGDGDGNDDDKCYWLDSCSTAYGPMILPAVVILIMFVASMAPGSVATCAVLELSSVLHLVLTEVCDS